MIVSPSRISSAAAAAMARFGAIAVAARVANGGSTPDGDAGTAPPCTRRSTPREARWSRSRRTVISDAPVAEASSATATRSAPRSRSTMIRCRSALFMP